MTTRLVLHRLALWVFVSIVMAAPLLAAVASSARTSARLQETLSLSISYLWFVIPTILVIGLLLGGLTCCIAPLRDSHSLPSRAVKLAIRIRVALSVFFLTNQFLKFPKDAWARGVDLDLWCYRCGLEGLNRIALPKVAVHGSLNLPLGTAFFFLLLLVVFCAITFLCRVGLTFAERHSEAGMIELPDC